VPRQGTLTRLSPTDTFAVVVVTHDSSEHLAGLADSLLTQLGNDDEFVVVDNASKDGTAGRARALHQRVRVLEQDENLGFCGGCNVGARSTQAPLLLFLNPDSRPHTDCLALLRQAATSHPEWAAWQAAVLLEDGRINSSGGVIHYLGMGWAGDCGRPLSALPANDCEVGFPSGAAMVIRRDAWDALEGFDPDYFMYGEDLDLGLRLWLAGQRVGLVPAARVTHSYEFHKGTFKWFSLERNRWRTVLSVYPAALLLLLLPALLALELAIIVVAGREGWMRAKLRAQTAVIAGLGDTLARRRRVQRSRCLDAAAFASHLSCSLDSPYLKAAGNPLLRIPQALYFGLVRRALESLARRVDPKPRRRRDFD
jgi:N-acetylglucosaminyl-diphospho-decaprenol L-rhamnosyltransferase